MIGVLVSGNGTNLQALIDAGLPLAAVASNRRDAYALLRAREAGIPTTTFSLDCHADREERDLAMATWLEERGVDLVVLAGYLHLLTKLFLDRFPREHPLRAFRDAVFAWDPRSVDFRLGHGGHAAPPLVWSSRWHHCRPGSTGGEDVP